MKKRKTAHLSIKISSPEKSDKRSGRCLAGCFFVLFSAGSGFYSCIRLTPYFSENTDFFFYLFLGIYLSIFLPVLYKKKKWLFLLLLTLPVSVDFLLDIHPSVLSLGFLLTAFLFWDFAVHPERITRRSIFTPAFILALYIFSTCVLTPAFSPSVFRANKPLYQTVNRSINFLETTFSKSGLKNTFSYAQKQGKQALDNSAPVYTNKTMFQFQCDSALNDTVYLRGFIGKTYTEASWISPEAKEWQSFLKENAFADDTIRQLFSLPYLSGSKSDSNSVKWMSLTPAFSPKFTYLPYGAEIPAHSSVSDSNEEDLLVSDSREFSCFPLTQSSASVLFSPAIPDSLQDAEKVYKTYVQKQYTSVPQETDSWLRKEISQLPVYSSMPKTPSMEDIQSATEEIKNFLHIHASYNLSLNSVPDSSSFLKEFLLNQHQGFCIHFATAGTLLFRMYGIPARYVSGYVIYPKDIKIASDGNYSCEIPDSNAHAWTEIYVGEGGWIPVDVTPSAFQSNTVSPDILPETDSLEKENSDTSGSTEFSAGNTDNDAVKTPAATGKELRLDMDADELKEAYQIQQRTAFFSFLLKILHGFIIVLIGIVLFIFLLYLRRALLFRKRMGYFAHNAADCYMTVFHNTLMLWKIQFHLPTANLTDDEFRNLCLEKLPEKEKDIFLEMYTEAETISFGAEKPETRQIRAIRHYYICARKKLLATGNLFKKIYYIFILGI